MNMWILHMQRETAG